MSLLHRKWRGNPAGKYAAGVLAAGVVLAFAGCGGNGEAPTDEAVPEFVLTYAENQAEDYPTTQGAYKFAELVEQRTGGRVKTVSYTHLTLPTILRV